MTPALLRNIVGQAMFQLIVMWTLVSRGDAIFGVPSHLSLGGAPSEHYTIVFNTCSCCFNCTIRSGAPLPLQAPLSSFTASG